MHILGIDAVNDYCDVSIKECRLAEIQQRGEQYLVQHLVYTFSFSTYGSNTIIPYGVEDKVAKPVSLYSN